MSDIAATTSVLPAARTRVRRVTGRLRAYFLLTKPRVIELLLVTTVPAMLLADGGIPSLDLVAARARRRGARRRRRQHHQLLDRARPRPDDATHARTGRFPPATSSRGRALVFGLALETVAFACSWPRREPAVGVPRGRRDALLRLRVHDLAQAAEPAEHRHRRRRRRGARARGLGRGRRAASPRRRGCCSRSCSSGRHRTSGPWRCATATTTPPPASRCSPS